MAEVRLDITVNDNGSVAVKQVAGALKEADSAAEKARKSVFSLSGAVNQIAIGAQRQIGVWLASSVSVDTFTRSVTAVLDVLHDAATAALEYSDKIVTMGQRTALSTDTLQVLAHVAKVGGTDLDTLAKSVVKMEVAIGKGDAAFKGLGLSVADLKKMSPDEAFERVGKAINAIGDPMARAAAGAAIFGKSFSEILPVLATDLSKAREEAQTLGLVIDGETLAASESLGDSIDTLSEAFDRMLERIGATITQSPALAGVIEQTASLVGTTSTFIERHAADITKWINIAILALAKLAEGIGLEIQLAAKLTKMTGTGWLMDLGKVEQLGKGIANLAEEYQKAILAKVKFNAIDMKGGGVMLPGHKLPKQGVVGNDFISEGQEAAARKAADLLQRRKDAEIKYMEESRTLWDKFYNDIDTMASKDMMTIINGSRKRAEQDLKDMSGRVDSKVLAELALAEFADMPATVEAVNVVVGKAKKSTYDWMDAVGALNDAFDAFGISSDSTLRKVTNTLVNVAQAGVGFAKSMQTGDVMGMITNGIKGVSAIVGGIKSLFGGASRAQKEAAEAAAKVAAEVTKNRDAYIKAAGGIDVLQAKAKSAGYTLDKLFDAKTVQEYEAAINELNGAFDKQKQANEALNAAMEKYGITIDQLGPKFAQQKLDEMAMSLLQDFELLKAAGVDLSVIYEKMGPDFEKYVQTVVASGGTIPEALRPIIEKMIELGLLTDQAGNKIDDIGQLHFAETLEDGIKSLIDTIHELVNALLGIPNVKLPAPQTTGGATTTGTGGGDRDPGYAAGGVVNVSPMGEYRKLHSQEAIVPIKNLGDFAAAIARNLNRSSAPAQSEPQQFHFYLDGEPVVASVARKLDGGSAAGLKVMSAIDKRRRR